jgi:hypothetical protein
LAIAIFFNSDSAIRNSQWKCPVFAPAAKLHLIYFNMPGLTPEMSAIGIEIAI